ncbi:hypothetical protein HETIRDRAFT_427436 [Heterobasidion irregulare TC 32-1]|uniref:Uncharacterized protein n=1 Tax=Heterobasidion irregulare (strain TC 32-1) TaxID=747525 RepID=W4K3J6_HETIT|nr:uncharacterized protein HETIRDRAFT_427436 [Heterobasidion irregulare TC 32-1]ETW80299.1 hypothetical protein HETIRDRAFT_427436 [Heterobasidion irregulare TC 32-1]
MPPSRRTPAVALPTASSAYATASTLAPDASSPSTRAPFGSIRGARDQDQDQDQGSHIKPGLHHASRPLPCPDLSASEHAYAGTQYCRAALDQYPTPSGPGPHACNTAGRWHRAALHCTAHLRDAEISSMEIASRHESGTFMHVVDDRWRCINTVDQELAVATATTRCRINDQQGVQCGRGAEIARDARFDAGLDRPDGIRVGDRARVEGGAELVYGSLGKLQTPQTTAH